MIRINIRGDTTTQLQKLCVVTVDHTFGKIKEDTPEDTYRETKICQNLLQNTPFPFKNSESSIFYDLVRKQDLTGFHL